jgi:hypothetical protein
MIGAIESDGEIVALCAGCLDRTSGIVGMADLLDSMKRRTRSPGVCPYCGNTEAHARATGTAGCPLCYESLRDVWVEFGIVRTGGEVNGSPAS